MDVMGWISVTNVLVVGVVSLVLYWIWKTQENFKMFKRMGMPGPPPSFLMGSSRDIQKLGFCDAFVEWRNKYGNLFGAFLPNPAVLVSDPDLLRDLMVKQFAHFPNRTPQKIMKYKPWEDNLTMLVNDHWKHVRSQLSPTFSSGKLKKMMPAIGRVLQNLNKYLKEKAEAGEEVELKSMAGNFTMDAIAGAAFGIHLDSLFNPDEPFNINGRKMMENRSKTLMAIMFLFPSLTPILRRLGLGFFPAGPTQFFVDILDAAFKERRLDQTSHSDFLQLLVDAETEREGSSQGPVDAEIDHSAQLTTSGQWNRKGLTEDEMKANALIFFVGGFDTVSIALSFTLFHLAANPEALKKAQEEIDKKLGKNPVSYDTANDLTYVDMCLNEALRLNPPGFIIDRQCVDDVEFGGYQIKKGTSIMIPVYALHRDPEIWPEPEKYLPERHTPQAKASRHPFAFLPFGHGPRNCIAMRLAQLEIRMAVASILQHHTPVLCDKSVYPAKVDPPQVRMVAKDGLWVKFKPRA
ncbi:hypothetical protein ACOMHN_011686 [Nucella lapillus]